MNRNGFQTADYSSTIHAYRDVVKPNYAQSVVNCFNISGLIVASGHFHSFQSDISTRIGESFVNDVDLNLENLGLSAERKVFGRFDNIFYQKNWLDISKISTLEDCIEKIYASIKKLDAKNIRNYQRYTHGSVGNSFVSIVCQNVTPTRYTYDVTVFGFDGDETKLLRERILGILN